MPITQKHRALSIGTPLGDDVLLLRSAHIQEQLGRPFRMELELRSEKHDIKFTDIVGQNVTVRLQLPDKKTRYFNGFVSRFSQDPAEPTGSLACYRATVVPWLWFLTRTADCRIFQKKSVPDIIKEVFRGHGFTDFSEKLSGTYRTWEYCVQYRETDFNFVSRLMEQEGIYYYFTHKNGQHDLVLADSYSAHEPQPGYEEVPYVAVTDAGSSGERITALSVETEVRPGTYALNDFDFEVPAKGLRVKSSVSRSHAASGFEVYDYPGEFTEVGDGEAYAKVRVEELHSQYEVCRGQTDARGSATGALFTLKNHPRAEWNREYLITGATYRLNSDVFFSEGDGDGFAELYSCLFTSVASSEPFRPARTTPKPLVQGPQTAIVVGPSGEEIYTDKYGRVKAQFHWDRYGKADKDSSCWIRVAQVWAGKKWGAMYIPRIGQEVIVEFLEGDPDRPIITGRVYNGTAMPPYALPKEQTKSTLKSNSSKGGGGFNEIRFEDKKGEEQVFIHAEKNEDVRVKNDSFEWVGNERHLIVKKDQFELVEGDKHHEVKGDRVGKIGGAENLTVAGDRLVSIKGSDNRAVTGDLLDKVTGDKSLTVVGNHNQKANQSISAEAGMDIHKKAGMNYALEAGMNAHIKAGLNTVIEGGVGLTIKVGGNFVSINPGGVFIKGAVVMINSGGAAGSGSGAKPKAPSAPGDPDVPTAPKEADDAKAGQVSKTKDASEKKKKGKALKKAKVAEYSPAAAVLKQAAKDGTPFCEECEKAKQEQKSGG